MSYAMRCPEVGLVFVDGAGQRCEVCGVVHPAFECGAPPKEVGLGRPRAPFKRHHSWIHGRDLTSWSDYHKANRELGIIDTGVAPDPYKEYEKPLDPSIMPARVEVDTEAFTGPVK